MKRLNVDPLAGSIFLITLALERSLEKGSSAILLTHS
ncbi:hypothetical protein ACVWXN_007073 [Bradyrhizobium sp. i1.4.4]